MKTFDLVVIGSGTAAQVASARVRKAGGCDPKKMLISGAEAI